MKKVGVKTVKIEVETNLPLKVLKNKDRWAFHCQTLPGWVFRIRQVQGNFIRPIKKG